MTWQDRITGLEYHKPSELQEHPGQWRDHPKAQADAMVGVLEEVGIAGALLAYHSERNGGLVLIDGHLRSGIDGDTPWPVLMLDVTDKEADYLLLTHDPLGAMAQSDAGQLDALLHAITTDNEAVTKMLAELAVDAGIDYGNGTEPEDDPGADVDQASELQEQWGTALGQVWNIGRHRLACGDCTDKAVVDAVMQGERAQLVMADPPYNVEYTGGSSNEHERADSYPDDKTGILYQNFLYGSLQNAFIYTDKNAVLHLWFSTSELRSVIGALDKSGWQDRSLIIWNKLKAHYGALGAQYKQRYEPMFYCYKKGSSPRWFGPSDEPNVWDEEQPHSNDLHPTMKPLPLYERSVRNHTEIDAIVYDPFAGSGTTMAAAERLGRTCFSIEISPAYCAVTLERLSGMGLSPELAVS